MPSYQIASIIAWLPAPADIPYSDRGKVYGYRTLSPLYRHRSRSILYKAVGSDGGVASAECSSNRLSATERDRALAVAAGMYRLLSS